MKDINQKVKRKVFLPLTREGGFNSVYELNMEGFKR